MHKIVLLTSFFALFYPYSPATNTVDQAAWPCWDIPVKRDKDKDKIANKDQPEGVFRLLSAEPRLKSAGIKACCARPSSRTTISASPAFREKK
jgi:hypothetical protein